MSTDIDSGPVAASARGLNGVCGKLAFALPLAVTMLRTSPTGQWRDDLPVVRALGLVPSGTEGFVSTALTQAFAVLPLGGRLLRAGWVSAFGLAVASALAYRLIVRALEHSLPTPRLSPFLALAATFTATLATAWQLEGTLSGGITIGAALALLGVWVALDTSPRRPTALGAVGALTLAESHAAALALAVALAGLTAAELGRRALVPSRRSVLGFAAGFVPLAALSASYAWIRPRAPALGLDLTGGLGASSLAAADAAAERTTALGAWLGDAGFVPCALALGGLVLGLMRPKLRRLGAPLLALVACDLAFPASRAGLLAADPMGPVRLLALVAISGASAVGVQALAAFVRRSRVPFAEPASVLLVVFHLTLAFGAAEASSFTADRRAQAAAETWTDEALASLPSGALLLVRSEPLAYRLIAAQMARGARPDLVVVPFPLLSRGNMAARLLRTEPALAPLVREMVLSGEPSEFALTQLADARPLFVEIDPSWDRRLSLHVAPRAFFAAFTAHPLARSDRAASLDEGADGFHRALRASRDPVSRDPATLAVLVSDLRGRATLLDALGDRDATERALRALQKLSPADPLVQDLEAKLLASRPPAAPTLKTL